MMSVQGLLGAITGILVFGICTGLMQLYYVNEKLDKIHDTLKQLSTHLGEAAARDKLTQ